MTWVKSALFLIHLHLGCSYWITSSVAAARSWTVGQRWDTGTRRVNTDWMDQKDYKHLGWFLPSSICCSSQWLSLLESAAAWFQIPKLGKERKLCDICTIVAVINPGISVSYQHTSWCWHLTRSEPVNKIQGISWSYFHCKSNRFYIIYHARFYVKASERRAWFYQSPPGELSFLLVVPSEEAGPQQHNFSSIVEKVVCWWWGGVVCFFYRSETPLILNARWQIYASYVPQHGENQCNQLTDPLSQLLSSSSLI